MFFVVPLHWWSIGNKDQFDRELQDAGTLDRSWESWVWGSTQPTPAQRATPPRGFEVYAPPMPSSAPPAYLDAVRKLYALPPQCVLSSSDLRELPYLSPLSCAASLAWAEFSAFDVNAVIDQTPGMTAPAASVSSLLTVPYKKNALRMVLPTPSHRDSVPSL